MKIAYSVSRNECSERKKYNKNPKEEFMSINTPNQQYFVYRYLPLNGVEYQAGDQVDLSIKQARFLLTMNFIGEKPLPDKPIKEPQSIDVKPSNKKDTRTKKQ